MASSRTWARCGSAGLARGGSLDNAIVVGKRAVLNDRLRFPDEFVRHKILDLVGDLFLLGRPLIGHVVARNGGHALNHRLVAAIREAVVPDRRRARGRVRPTPGRSVTRLGSRPPYPPVPGVAAGLAFLVAPVPEGAML